MRSAKADKEPRAPRRKARRLTTRGSRRRPSKPPGAWGGAAEPKQEENVAARFRRGDILLKPQHEPSGVSTLRAQGGGARTAPFAKREGGADGAKRHPRGTPPFTPPPSGRAMGRPAERRKTKATT